jgi:dolichyl-phosphate-mannose--protein O-mannosyl transferase
VLRRVRWKDAVAFGGFAAMYVPWLFVGRTQFIFYLLPAVLIHVPRSSCPRSGPCLCRYVRAVGIGSAAAVAVALVTVAYAPVWKGIWIDGSWADRLRLLPG